MKIQNLAVIFIIIILPISMILTSYVQNQVKTLSLQTSYDAKLTNATYDALKAFQLNTINSDSSDIANSKLRDIEASVNTFFNSIASNFNMVGYNQDILKEYVPALVYTMYDGYYIYSPFTNKLDDINENEVIDSDLNTETKSDSQILSQENSDATYKEGDRISGLKPYIYYSCRYVRGSDDFVITYSLDNYITIQGKINGKDVFDAGYLLDNISITNSKVKYRNVEINDNERLEEYISSENKKYTYVKINGVKYYYDESSSKWFSILNGQKYETNEVFNENSIAGSQYYKEAYDFTQKVLGTGNDDYNLGELTGNDAVDEKGIHNLTEKLGNYKIFDHDNKSIEDPDSNFNQQRLAVIRYSIEKNLSIAIANYNNYTTSNPTNFQMPELKEDEWDKILNNVSIISFLQGLNIGGKIYNGYSIINNNKNQEVINEEAIYITTSDDNQYHRPNDTDLNNKNVIEGVLNIDLEKKSITTGEGNIDTFVPKRDSNGNIFMGCYSSIVAQTEIEATDNMYKYMENKGNISLAQKYFTALGRERYSMYKTNNNVNKIKEKFYKK